MDKLVDARQDPDTPANWVAWAESKGYETDHLECFKDKRKLESATNRLKETAKSEPENIPGRQPKRAVAKLAVKAAWEIEQETGSRPADREVMVILQTWAKNATHAETLHKSNLEGLSVMWLTGKSKKRIYTLEACGKTLSAWNKSRRESDTKRE